jgi:hypothetical protein
MIQKATASANRSNLSEVMVMPKKISYTIDTLVKGGGMKSLEHLLYESLPYTYAGLGLYGLTLYDVSKVAAVGGLMLLFCGYQVFQVRQKHRRIRQHSFS